MGREGIWIEQPSTEPVDVADWRPDEEFEVYPEGARDKSLLHSPADPTHSFLLPNHRYLFKHSFERYPEQYWAEIIAYRAGCLLGVPVPSAFVAFDSDNGVSGALIEWFLGYPGEPEERYVPGGDIMVNMIPSYERRKGDQHNFTHVELYHDLLKKMKIWSGEKVWLDYWCDMLLFDALIGNTDRHQDNWGLLWSRDGEGRAHVRPAPVFDNGTSLGHEIIERKLPDFADAERLANYVNRGHHHIRWHIGDSKPQQHVGMLSRLVETYPNLADRVQERLQSFDIEGFATMINVLTEFDVPVRLSPERADFVIRLTRFRYQNFMNYLVE